MKTNINVFLYAYIVAALASLGFGIWVVSLAIRALLKYIGG